MLAGVWGVKIEKNHRLPDAGSVRSKDRKNHRLPDHVARSKYSRIEKNHRSTWSCGEE